MINVFGSHLCPDCIAFRKNLDHYGVEYKFTDILESLPNLKKFLSLRDSNPVFEAVRNAGGIGIPAIVREDGIVSLDWEGEIRAAGYEVLAEEATGEACSIDHKNC